MLKINPKYGNIPRKDVNILGVGITGTPKDQLLRILAYRLGKLDKKTTGSKKIFITTPNPEHIMLSRTDKVFKAALDRSDIAIPDGIGVIAANKFLRLPKEKKLILRPLLYLKQGIRVGLSILNDRSWLTSELEVIRGREFFLELLTICNQYGSRVFLLGGENGVSEKCRLALERRFKKVQFENYDGPLLDEDANPRSAAQEKINKISIDKINKFKPDVLFVAFEAPKQEKWVYKNLERLNIKVVMIVGGTFDYIAGVAKLPPSWMANAGLEWIWRLIRRPQRIKRILTAFPYFALRVYLLKLLDLKYSSEAYLN